MDVKAVKYGSVREFIRRRRDNGRGRDIRPPLLGKERGRDNRNGREKEVGRGIEECI